VIDGSAYTEKLLLLPSTTDAGERDDDSAG
jgi:hypothetical protein